MPILSSNYISNWYKLKDVDTDVFYVIENLTSTFSVNQNKKDLIQGEELQTQLGQQTLDRLF